MPKNMKGFIFTVDAIFSLIVATAAIAILIYSHFIPTGSYSAPAIAAQSKAQGLLNTQLKSLLSESALQVPFKSPYLYNGSGAEVASFDGVNSWIRSNSSQALNPSSNVTMSAWIYIYNYSSNSGVGSGIVGKGTQYEISVNSLGYAAVDGVLPIAPVYSKTTVPLGKWVHIVGELSDNGTATICVNLSCNSATGASENSLYSSSSPLQIGNGTISGPLGTYFDGMISNIQLYNTSLSANQLGVLQSEGVFGNPVNGSSLIGWWPLSGSPNQYNESGSTSSYVSYVNTGVLPIGSLNASPSWNLLTAITNAYVSGNGPYGSLIYSTIGNLSSSGIFINGTYAPSISSAYFDGSANVNIPKSRLIASPEFSVSLWFNQQSASTYNYMHIISIGGTYSAFLDSTNLLWSGFPSRSISITSPTLGAWYNLVAVDNGTYCWSYLNGVETGGAWPCSPGSLSPQSICIGCNNFVGYISNVQIYPFVISAPQAYAIYLQGAAAPPLQGEKLIGWWPMEGNGLDLSQNFDSGNESGVAFVNSGYVPYSYTNSYGVSAVTLPISASPEDGIAAIYNSTVAEWQ
ncbi:MAG: LamG domain-containing protein [Candidatus Micrarchaeaceae archaeon]